MANPFAYVLDNKPKQKTSKTNPFTYVLSKKKENSAQANDTSTDWNAVAGSSSKIYDPNAGSMRTIAKSTQAKKAAKARKPSQLEQNINKATEAKADKLLGKDTRPLNVVETPTQTAVRASMPDAAPVKKSTLGKDQKAQIGKIGDRLLQHPDDADAKIIAANLDDDSKQYLASYIKGAHDLAEPSSRDVLIQGILSLPGAAIPALSKAGSAAVKAIEGAVKNPVARAVAKTGVRAAEGAIEGAAINEAASLPDAVQNPQAWAKAQPQIIGGGAAMGAVGKAVIGPILQGAVKLTSEGRARISAKFEQDMAAGRLNSAVEKAVKGDKSGSINDVRMSLEEVPEFRDLDSGTKAQVLRDIHKRIRGEAVKGTKEIIKQSKASNSIPEEDIKQTSSAQPGALPATEQETPVTTPEPQNIAIGQPHQSPTLGNIIPTKVVGHNIIAQTEKGTAVTIPAARWDGVPQPAEPAPVQSQPVSVETSQPAQIEQPQAVEPTDATLQPSASAPVEPSPNDRQLEVLSVWHDALNGAQANPEKFKAVSKAAYRLWTDSHKKLDSMVSTEPQLLTDATKWGEMSPEDQEVFTQKWDGYWKDRNDLENFTEQMDSHPMVEALRQMEAAPLQEEALKQASQDVREQNRAAYQFGRPTSSDVPVFSRNTKTGRIGATRLKGYDINEVADALGISTEEISDIIRSNAPKGIDNRQYGSDTVGWRTFGENTVSDFLTTEEAKVLTSALGLKMNMSGGKSSTGRSVPASIKTSPPANIEPAETAQSPKPAMIEEPPLVQAAKRRAAAKSVTESGKVAVKEHFIGKTGKPIPDARVPEGRTLVDEVLDADKDRRYSLQKKANGKYGIYEHSRVSNKTYSTYGKPMHSVVSENFSESEIMPKWEALKSDLAAKHQPVVETKGAQVEIPVSSEPIAYTKPYNATAKAFSDSKIRGKEGQKPIEGGLFEEPQQDLFASSGAASEGGYARPEEIGEHGPVYRDYRRTSNEAVRKLLTERKGEIPEALHHQAVPGGWIDLLWGNAGDTHQKGYGLAKIERWHPEVLDDLQGHLDKMHVVDVNNNSIILRSGTHEAVIRRNWKGSDKHWLLTTYKKLESSSAERTIDVSDNPEGSTERQTPQSQDDSAILNNTTLDKNVNHGSSGQASGGGYARPTKHAPPTLKAKPSGKVDMSKGVAPMEMPEIVGLAKALGGRYPVIKKQLRLMHGTARGAFYGGNKLSGSRIELRADLFLGDELGARSARLKGKTKAERKAERSGNMDKLRAQVAKEHDLSLDDVVVQYERDSKTGKDIYRAYQINPDLAAQVLSHEIGHHIDYVPDETLKRGNILGHVATLKHFLSTTISELPTKKNEHLDTATRRKLGAEAKKALDGSGLNGDDLRDEVKRVYKALIDKELEKRGFVKRDDVMDELKHLSQVWKPFDPETAEPSYLKYRHSPTELYADAVSVLFNDPSLAQREAPTFYKTFINYMERKPAVKKAYQAIQNRYTNREAVADKRLSDIYDMQERGNEARQSAMLRNEKASERVIDTLMTGLIDEQWPALKGIGKREQLMGTEKHDIGEVARNARLELEESKYIGSQVANYMDDLNAKVLDKMTKNNLSYEDVGTYLFLKRVGADRRLIANPLGHTEGTATETLGGLKKRLGPERFESLEEAAREYRDLRESHVFPKIEKAGIYDHDLMDLIKESRDYAKFSVTKYLEDKFGGSVSARVHKQVGTLAEVENPFVATVLQDISMLRAAKINTTKRAVIDDLINAGEAQPAETKYSRDVMGKVPVEPKDPRLGLITIMRDGAPEHYCIAKPIAEMFDYRPVEATKIGEVWARLNGVFRDVMVSKNPGWMAFNIIRDTKATIKNIPDIRLQDTPRLAAAYGSALKDSWNEVFRGRASEDVRAMREDFMLTPERMYSAREHAFDNEIERMVNDFVLRREDVGTSRNIVGRAWLSLLETMDKFGKVSERTSKLAGYKYLDRYGLYDRKELAHIIRTRVGTPDFKRRGSWQAITNNIFMFSNVNKEGARSAWESFQNNKGAYIWKTIAMNILPKLMLIAAGVFSGSTKAGDDNGLHRCINGIPDYDKRFYDIVPLGLDKHGKSVYLRIPQDYEGQFWGALVWDMTHVKIAGKDGAISLMAEQSPYKMHPLITTATDLYQYYVQGNNPVDAYRGRNVISDTAFEAGGWTASEQLLKHAWTEVGGGVLYTPTWGGIAKDSTPIEQMLRLPGLNALGRFIKVSDRGQAEAMQDISEDIRRQEARRRTAVQSEIFKTVNSGKAKEKDVIALYRKLVSKHLITTRSTSPREFYRTFQRYANRVDSDPLTNALLSAKSTVEKVALLKMYRPALTKKEYKNKLLDLRKRGVISKNVIVELNAKESSKK